MSSRSIDSFFRPAPPVPTSSASSAAPASSASSAPPASPAPSAPSAPPASSTSSSSQSVASSASKPKQRRSGHDRYKGRDTRRRKERIGAILNLEELGLGLRPFAQQSVPRGRKKGKSSQVSVPHSVGDVGVQSRIHNPVDAQASPPSWQCIS